MLRLDKAIKPWKNSASLNDHINLYGFWNETAFLTKSGDLGMVLRVPGVDYESLDFAEQEYAVNRLEAALKSFGPGFHIYQYLFKSNRPDIPFAKYDDPIVEAAIEQRLQQRRQHGLRSGGEDHAHDSDGEYPRVRADIAQKPQIKFARRGVWHEVVAAMENVEL